MIKKIIEFFSTKSHLFLWLCVISLCIIGGCISIFFHGDDYIIEEVAEDIIEYKSGIDFDLSPSTPENPLLRRH